jgi:hypothetical protein
MRILVKSKSTGDMIRSAFRETLSQRKSDMQIDRRKSRRKILNDTVSVNYSLPPLLALPLIFPLACPGSLAEPDLDSGPPGPGYAFIMLARVAGTGGGDGWS